MDSIVKNLNSIFDILTGQNLPAFIHSIRGIFIVVTIVTLVIIIYLRVRAGVYGDRVTAWKWKLKGLKKDEDDE